MTHIWIEKEKLEKALEALEYFKKQFSRYWDEFDEQAITSLRQAIATEESSAEREKQTHERHCNQGEWIGVCKYSDPNCPTIATEESSATQEPVEKDWRKQPWGFGEKRLHTIEEVSNPQPKAEQKREPLTDEQFLELLLRKGSTELVGYSTFISNSIQMQGRVGLLNGAKLLKEFVEAAHGIKGTYEPCIFKASR